MRSNKLSGDQPGSAQQTTDFQPLIEVRRGQPAGHPDRLSAEWFEYNSAHFTGWPTQSNPYETGQPSGTNNGPGTGTRRVRHPAPQAGLLIT